MLTAIPQRKGEIHGTRSTPSPLRSSQMQASKTDLSWTATAFLQRCMSCLRRVDGCHVLSKKREKSRRHKAMAERKSDWVCGYQRYGIYAQVDGHSLYDVLACPGVDVNNMRAVAVVLRRK